MRLDEVLVGATSPLAEAEGCPADRPPDVSATARTARTTRRTGSGLFGVRHELVAQIVRRGARLVAERPHEVLIVDGVLHGQRAVGLRAGTPVDAHHVDELAL